MRRIFLILFVLPLWKCGGADVKDETSLDGMSFTEYYENGSVRHVGEELDGKWEGQHKWYYESGELELLANYIGGVEHGKQYFFYKNNQLEYVNTKVRGTIVDTAFYFSKKGKLEVYQIFNKLGKVVKKSFFTTEGKLKREHFYTSVYYNEAPLLNTFVVYDEEGEIVHDESVYYTISVATRTVFKKNDSEAYCELTYNGEFREKYILLYGEFDEEFFSENSNIDTIYFEGDRVKLPLNTEKSGHNIARFRIEDWKWCVHPQNPEKGEGYMKRFVHGSFEYYVE